MSCGPSSQFVSDETLRERVCRYLEPAVTDNRLDVKVEDGVVTLRGQFVSHENGVRCTRLCRTIPGVVAVTAHLAVDSRIT